MSVIVWDGKTLAVDRGATDGVTLWETRKLREFGKFAVVGSGNAHDVGRLMTWFLNGHIDQTFPNGNLADLFVVHKGSSTLLRYHGSPYPEEYIDIKVAFGSGKDYAFGALAMGATAAQAVEVACKFSTTCGHGVDVYEAVE
jgi:ATP-dependent HslUV protease subunit HslV